MILSFKTQINGKQTCFVEKIWKGLKDEKYNVAAKNWLSEDREKEYPVDAKIYPVVNPKIHTIRKDDKNRWKAGMMIDFFINVRQKNMYQFAPRIQVVSTQFIGIYPAVKEVTIDNKFLFPSQIEHLAINDGFDSSDDFFEYFNETFNGVIIHWTDLKY